MASAREAVSRRFVSFNMCKHSPAIPVSTSFCSCGDFFFCSRQSPAGVVRAIGGNNTYHPLCVSMSVSVFVYVDVSV